MKKKIIYKDEPMKLGERVYNLLPPIEEIIFRQATKKITIALSEKSIEYFKQQALKHDVSYQVMIRELLDTYVQKYQLSDSDE